MATRDLKRQRELELLENLARKKMRRDPVIPPCFGPDRYDLFPSRLVSRVCDHSDEHTRLSRQTQTLFASTVTENNETLVRSYHRSLASQTRVWVVTELDGREIWVVQAQGSTPIYDAVAGGREIHILPDVQMPAWAPEGSYPLREDPVPGRIDPRQFLPLAYLAIIRQAFPGSVGVRILISGVITLLFASQEEIEKSWSREVYTTVGALRINYEVADYLPTATVTAGYGQSVSNVKGGTNNHGCLGLKLCLPNGEHAITTTTHAFVKLLNQRPSWRRLQLSETLLRIREALKNLRPIKALLEIPAVAHVRNELGQTPLGQQVWIAGSDELVGTIKQTYDPHPANFFPFPTGFRHDLSLISGDNLPDITNPPGFPAITGWASCEEVLDGAPVFVCRNDVMVGRWTSLEGRGMSSEAQQAVCVGSEFTWEKGAYCQNASILWRTNTDMDTASAFSGSVLCCGKPTDVTARAVVFQNFQAPLKAGHVEGDHRNEIDSEPASFKGGFVLPDEITRSTILMRSRAGPEAFQSLPTRARVSEEDERRRSISGP